MKEELAVSLIEFLEIIDGDCFLVRFVSASNSLQEDLSACLEIDNEIGLTKTGAQYPEDLFIEVQLIVVQIQVSKDLILFEEVIADRHTVEEILLQEIDLLLEAAKEKEDLGLEGVFSSVLIKAGEKGIVLHLFVYISCVKLSGKEFYKAGLTRPDWSFDSDIPWRAARWFHEG